MLGVWRKNGNLDFPMSPEELDPLVACQTTDGYWLGMVEFTLILLLTPGRGSQDRRRSPFFRWPNGKFPESSFLFGQTIEAVERRIGRVVIGGCRPRYPRIGCVLRFQIG